MSDPPSPSSPFSDPVSDPDPEPPRLESEPDERRRIRPWHLALMGILVGYPLGVGPVVWLSETLDPNQKYSMYLAWIYAPLEFLHRNVPPVRAFYDWYLPFFGTR